MASVLVYIFFILWIITIIIFGIYLAGHSRRHAKTIERHLADRDETYLALQKSDERYNKLISHMNEGLIFTDNKDIIRFANKCVCNILKTEKDKVLGRSIFDYILSKPDADKLGLPYALKRPGCSHREVMQLVRDNGEMFWASLNISYLDNLQDHMPGAIMIIQDITEQKMSEEKLLTLTRKLNQRVKQLDCLFEISDIINIPNILPEEIFRRALDIIPQGLRYSNEVCVQIVTESQTYSSSNFVESPNYYQVPIKLNQKKYGMLRVGYKEPGRQVMPDGLQINEKVLLKNIAEKLAQHIDQKMQKISAERDDT